MKNINLKSKLILLVGIGIIGFAIFTVVTFIHLAALNAPARILYWLLGIFLSVCVICLLLTVITIRSITRPVVTALAYSRSISEGDLSSKVNLRQKDEIGQIVKEIDNIQKQFNNIITGIYHSTNQTFESSNLLEDDSMLLAEATAEQAQSIAEIAEQLDNISILIDRNSTSMNEARSITNQSVKDISAITICAAESQQSISAIKEKLKTIGDIAFQTNLLAINAAIEAAHMKDRNSGFQSIANEIQQLATFCKTTAKEIDDLSNKTSSISEKTWEMLDQLHPQIKRVSQITINTASAYSSQNDTISTINNEIKNFSILTQQNANLSEKLAKTSSHLAEQSQNQLNEIKQFNTGN